MRQSHLHKARACFLVSAFLLAPASWPALAETSLDAGYRQMYNLEFAQAHQTFGEWERLHPDDPLGPASNAAAYLFAEFDRMHILQAELFVDDNRFRRMSKLTPDAAARQGFEQELNKADQLAQTALARNSHDQNALFASILSLGLRSDYQALVEKRNLQALKTMKSSRVLAQQLLKENPGYYDAYLAVGVENYMLSLKPAPLRWMLQWSGAEADAQKGIETLRNTAEKGRYLAPYARLLLAVAALRNKDCTQGKRLLQGLAEQFPRNPLYSEQITRLGTCR